MQPTPAGPRHQGVKGVMSLALQPLRQSTSHAPVYQKSHGSPTDTAAGVSPAITAWA